jgi:hypothetical protein
MAVVSCNYEDFTHRSLLAEAHTETYKDTIYGVKHTPNTKVR